MITSLKQPAKCIRCGGRLSAPDKCTYVDEEFVCYHWICPKCGCEFDASTCLYQDAPLAPEIVEKFAGFTGGVKAGCSCSRRRAGCSETCT